MSIRWFGAFVSYAVVLGVIFLAPYDFKDGRSLIKQRLEAFQSMPLARLQSGSDLNSLFRMIRMAVWFGPFGALAALASAHWARTASGIDIWRAMFVMIIAGWAPIIELAQVFLPSHFAERH